MKISVNSIRSYNDRHGCAADPAPDGVDKLAERIGAQLAAVEEIIPIGKKYEGIIIVRVVECHKHENSDHLNVCMIDDGGAAKDVERDSDGHVQVVCGAPNVREGLTVAWLPPGSTVPASFDGEPFVLSVREIRGVASNGMLASAKELALGDSHDGILEIDDDVKPGTLFAEQYDLADDAVIDMENKMFTHRPDLFGTLGIAREIAGIQGQKFTSPEWYRADAGIDVQQTTRLDVAVRNEIPDLVPRFAVVPLSDVTVRQSPVWLQVELSRLGVRPINNVVDLTNYYMLLTGQPLHAYDYDKVVAQDDGADSATLVVRHPHDGEKLTLLNGKTIEPHPDAIMIASDTKAIGLGGVMGGGETEIDDSTTNIILECATFDMYSIRRTSMANGIFSDAVTRFNKGQSPLQNMAVLAKIVDDMQRIVGAQVAGPVIDDNHVPDAVKESGSLHAPLTVSVPFINSRLGLDLKKAEMLKLLENVAFKADDTNGTHKDDRHTDEPTLTVSAPFWRTDIEIPEDIIEEIGRLYGYDKLPVTLPRRDLTPAVKNGAFEQQAGVREILSRSGANEVLNYSFIPGTLLDKTGQNKDRAYKLSNALSPELQYYRLSLTPSLLDKVHANIKAGYDEFALFEIGKAHADSETDDEGLPREFDRLALVFAAEAKHAAAAYSGAAFYQARKYLLSLFSGNSLPYKFMPLAEVAYDDHMLLEQMVQPFDPDRAAALRDGENIIGIVGEYKASVRKALKLPVFSAGFELFLSGVPASAAGSYLAQPRYPKVIQDICLKVPSGVSYQALNDFVYGSLTEGQPDGTLIELTPLDIYQRADDSDHKQITFRFSIASYDRTLTDAEVAAMLAAVAGLAADEFGAEKI